MSGLTAFTFRNEKFSAAAQVSPALLLKPVPDGDEEVEYGDLGCPFLPHVVLTLTGQYRHSFNDDRPRSLPFLPLGGRDLSVFGCGLIKYPASCHLEHFNHE